MQDTPSRNEEQIKRNRREKCTVQVTSRREHLFMNVGSVILDEGTQRPRKIRGRRSRTHQVERNNRMKIIRRKNVQSR